jgi:hypothetical protein
MRGHTFCCLSLLAVLALAGQPLSWGYRDGQGVSFDLYRDYLIVAQGSAGPLKGLNFLLDTGANPSVIDRRLAQRLHLQESPASLAVIAGNVPAGRAVLPSLEFGPLRRDNFQVLVEDLSFFQKAFPVRIDAVIGLDVLGQSPFIIDYRSREIHFGSIPTQATSLPLRIQGGLPIVDAELDHVPVHLLFDTGAASLILFGPVAPMKISLTIGEFERTQVRLQSLKLGEANFGRQEASLVKGRSNGSRDFDGLLSPTALGITKVAFDLRQGLLAFNR